MHYIKAANTNTMRKSSAAAATAAKEEKHIDTRTLLDAGRQTVAQRSKRRNVLNGATFQAAQRSKRRNILKHFRLTVDE